ncbi:DUF433 domain-containing protein [Candidatus Pacearchaeota archaeon]|nr:DUF433 domain-containing protein [Candidatus Pacearchaeota archaeon]
MTKVVVNEKIRFGKPIIDGTRITVEEILGALAGGMNFEEIEKEYGVNKENILAALKYATDVISEEQIGMLKV